MKCSASPQIRKKLAITGMVMTSHEKGNFSVNVHNFFVSPFLALPNYVKSIEGYSMSKGRMYFSDSSGNAKMSSADGKTIEVAEALPTDVSSLPAKLV